MRLIITVPGPIERILIPRSGKSSRTVFGRASQAKSVNAGHSVDLLRRHGQEEARLHRLALETVEFVGAASEDVLYHVGSDTNYDLNRRMNSAGDI
jgi:hypothetical protein